MIQLGMFVCAGTRLVTSFYNFVVCRVVCGVCVVHTGLPHKYFSGFVILIISSFQKKRRKTLHAYKMYTRETCSPLFVRKFCFTFICKCIHSFFLIIQSKGTMKQSFFIFNPSSQSTFVRFIHCLLCHNSHR